MLVKTAETWQVEDSNIKRQIQEVVTFVHERVRENDSLIEVVSTAMSASFF